MFKVNTVLINVSNHPSNEWSGEQKNGWNEIIDVPFPKIDPNASCDEIEETAYKLYEKIIRIHNLKSESSVFVMLVGEFSLCYILYDVLKQKGIGIAIPATERKPDGSFNFVNWRIL